MSTLTAFVNIEQYRLYKTIGDKMTTNDLDDILYRVDIINKKVRDSVSEIFIALEVIEIRRIIKRLKKELNNAPNSK